MRIVTKLKAHVARCLGARRFGIPYSRAAKLHVPERLKINGSWLPVRLPDDKGIKSDILGCLLEDVYGLRNLSQAPRTILDIGANVGLFSLAARSCFPEAIIHAYEPNPRTLQYLQYQGVGAAFQVFPEAVGASEGAVYIEDSGDTNLARTRASSMEGAEVTQVSLRKAVERLGGNVEFAKIDCEGAEWDLFETEEPWRAIKVLRMEYHLFKNQTYPQVVDVLRRLGFAIAMHRPGSGAGLIWCERTAV